jgi:diguanylate cyclase (GGDEF)-like protein
MEAAEEAILTSGLDGSNFGIALFDLDHFKSVNDSYGHLIGDQVLAAVAEVLQSTARHGDIVGRFGGEEFVVFLPGASLDAVATFAERVRAAVQGARIQAEDAVIHVTISAGVAAIPSCADSLNEAIRIADDRLYAAKRAGRNRVVRHDKARGRHAA